MTAAQVVLKIARDQILYRQNALFVEVPTIPQEKPRKDQKGKGEYCAAGDSDNRRTEHMPCKCFRCVSKYHLIEMFLKPPKENDNLEKKVHLNERGNRIPQRE